MDDPSLPPDDGGHDVGMATVVAPQKAPEKKRKGQGIPKWNVILWDSDEHTYQYVMLMLKELFGHTDEQCFLLAQTVDKQGKAIVFTTTQEHAELKRDQILAYGKDEEMKNCQGSMHCTIESCD